MSDPPRVSVLIPCWGCEQYIGEAIESALAQTFRSIEVVVVEDCGTDGTYEKACQFRDPRLRVIRNDRNYGQYGNKNRALQLSRGSLVKYLDGDDVLEPRAVELLVDLLDRAGPSCGVAFGRFRSIDQDGRLFAVSRRWGVEGRARGKEVLGWVTRMQMAGSMFGNVSPHLFRREALEEVGGFPNDNAGPGDLQTFLKLLCVTDVAFLEEPPVARYRSHAGSMGSRTFGVKECGDFATMVEELEPFFARQSDLPKHLKDPVWMRRWRVWAGGHNIFSSFQRKLRRLPNQFDAIRAMYESRGLSPEFEWYMRNGLVRYARWTLGSKLRRAVGAPAFAPVFTRRFRGA